ncbi:C5a anaphylatoxin chemotactic receptor 1 [Conger conger]|uniref:C5a anaphylatoxin chemotactic receptor 1 n=1 Tax=Conger conger TaxID=82655 RepID=UPI002A5A2A38|nr:C5a anaphylatoxin chemotactic receptor 1 [Conger conger]
MDDYDYGNSTDDYRDLIVEGPSALGPPQTAALVCYGLVFLLGVPGNAVVAWVTVFRMPRSANTQWFSHLALADLLCCLSLPLLMVPLARDQHWPYGWLGCKLLSGVFNLTMYCSVLLLVLISLDRWLLVSRPVWCQNHRTARRAGWACLGVWVLALLLSLPHALHMEERVMGRAKVVCESPPLTRAVAWTLEALRSVLGFALPFLVIVACHGVVYCRTVRGAGGARSPRTLRVICAVVVSFFACLLPLHVTSLAALLVPADSPRRPGVRLAGVLTLCLAYFNCCLNPLLYVCLGRSFKDSLRRSVRGLFSFLGEEPARGAPGSVNTKSTSDNLQEKSV